MNPYFSAAKVLRIIFITAAALLLVAAFQWYRSFDAPTGDPYISPHRRLELLRASAAEKFKQEAAGTVGYRRTLSEFLNDSDDDVRKWSAHARVEIINRIGGIEVTNLLFRFEPQSIFGQPYALCYVDLRWQKPYLDQISTNSSRIEKLRLLEAQVVSTMQMNEDFMKALKISDSRYPLAQTNLYYAEKLGDIRASITIAESDIRIAREVLSKASP